MSAREYFWGVELSEDKREVIWDPEKEDVEDDIDDGSIQHFLFLKQAVLGPDAKEGERNIVEIGADDFDGNTVKQPLFSLKLGLNESTIMDIGAQPPLTLKLISGTGPVCLSGQHALELKDDDFDLLEEEAIEEAEESPMKFTPKLQNSVSKKRPASTAEGPAKKAKIDKSEESKVKVSKATPKQATKDEEDEDDEEDDEDFSIDDEDEMSSGDEEEAEEESGDEEDESSDDDSDKSPAKPTKKSGKIINGAGPKGQKKILKKKESSSSSSLDELKKCVMTSPGNKPKKQGKFLNFVKHKYNADDKTAHELWTWYKTAMKE